MPKANDQTTVRAITVTVTPPTAIEDGNCAIAYAFEALARATDDAVDRVFAERPDVPPPDEINRRLQDRGEEMAMTARDRTLLIGTLMPSTGMLLYDAACKALAEARSIDEAKDMHDKAAALKAMQSHNAELELMASEIRLRAKRRIGELSAKLETSPRGGKGGGSGLPSAGKSAKSAALKAANLSTSEANRCEHIAAVAAEEFEAVIEK